MRIPSGKTDQKIFFVAVDSTDLVTRKTGLTGFTVYRSRNGGTATVYTTPTVAELSAANMPGVYCLTIDEDTTIGASSDSEEYCVHITKTAMAPITRTIELYRRDTTTGRTLAVDSNSRVDVGAVLGTAQTAGNLAAMITAVDDYIDTEVAAIKAKTDNIPVDPADASDIAASFTTVNATLATIAGYIDTEVAAIKAKTDNLPASPSSLDAAGVRAAVGLATANFDTQLGGLSTKLDVIDDYIDTEVAAIKAKTDNLPADPADASDVTAATDAIFARIGAPVGLSISDDIANVSTGGGPTVVEIRAEIDTNSTQLAAIKAKTDNLPVDPADASDIAAAFIVVEDAITALSIPTASTNANALLDSSNGVETGLTVRQALRLISSVLVGKSSGHPGSPVYRNVGDTKDRITATVSSGNRSVVTTDAT